MGLVPIEEVTCKRWSPSPLCEDIARKRSSVSREKGSSDTRSAHILILVIPASPTVRTKSLLFNKLLQITYLLLHIGNKSLTYMMLLLQPDLTRLD